MIDSQEECSVEQLGNSMVDGIDTHIPVIVLFQSLQLLPRLQQKESGAVIQKIYLRQLRSLHRPGFYRNNQHQQRHNRVPQPDIRIRQSRPWE